MPEWLDGAVTVPWWLLAVASAALLVIIIVLLIAWLRARSRRSKERAERIDIDRAAVELELALREQLGRMRIVRELHDVAVHSVSVIISQADGARYAAQTDPTVAVRATGTIADTARKTLADLRRAMNVVREGEAVAAPQPRLKTARDLFKVMRNAGLNIVFEESGTAFDLQQGAELAIYRILQESLSNALKYGGEGTEVKVSFTWRGDSLQVLIDDDGVRNQARLEGHDPNDLAKERTYTIDDDLHALTDVVSGPGITEMRERAALFGGVFNAYAVPGVGFSVAAVFPALRYDNGVHGVNLETP